MKPLNIRPLKLALLMGLLLAGGARAALFEDEEARRAILDLRQKMESTQGMVRQQAEENAQLRRSLVDLQGQIDALQAELSKSRGVQEQLAKDLSDVQLRQRDAQSALNERMRRFEPLTVKLDGHEFEVEPAEKREYETAVDLFRKGDFASAQTGLQRLLQRYPQSGYLPSALFWLGNAAYALKDYKSALTQWRQMLTLSPDHVRAPEALLSTANVQSELKDTKAARKSLEDLLKAYPQSEAATSARERLAKLR